MHLLTNTRDPAWVGTELKELKWPESLRGKQLESWHLSFICTEVGKVKFQHRLILLHGCRVDKWEFKYLADEKLSTLVGRPFKDCPHFLKSSSSCDQN